MYRRLFVQINLHTASDEEILLIPGLGQRMLGEFKEYTAVQFEYGRRVKKGSPFPESVKLEARRRAFFRCDYCHDRPGDQVHHLLAQEHGGLGVIEKRKPQA